MVPVPISRFQNEMFMHDYAPSPESKFTNEFFDHKEFTREKIMEWLPSSSDQNPIENLWSTEDEILSRWQTL